MGKTDAKVVARKKRIRRIRKNITGSPDKPRLRVFKSAKHIYAQLIDDVAGHTLVTVSTVQKELKAADVPGKTAKARKVGEMLAKTAKENGIKKVIFDRGGYIYHGRVKALAEGAREGGLVF